MPEPQAEFQGNAASRIFRAMMPETGPRPSVSARQADLNLLARAPSGFLDTTHFDTVRFPPPAWALDQFVKAAQDGQLAYSGYRGHPEVLQHVAKVASAQMGISIDWATNLLLTPGTQAGLFASLSTLVDDRNQVVVMDPDYLFTARILRFLNCEVVYVPLICNDGRFEPDMARLEEAFRTGAKTLVFSHPNNPTGAVYSHACLKRIAALARQFNAQVIVDQLYSRLVYGDTDFVHLAAIPGMESRVVTLLGPSKTESLSGYRVGVVVGPAQTIAAAENVLALSSLRCPAYAQTILLPWMSEDHDWLKERLQEFSLLRQLTIKKLGKLPRVRILMQEATAYVWVDVSELGISDDVLAEKLLTDACVLVSPGYQFGPSGKGKFRMCYARDEHEWEQALERITAVLNKLATSNSEPQSSGVPS